VYVQVHNRGIASGANVTVKLLYANASAGLPPLPADFWTAFPADSTNTSVWHPIGTAKVIPSLSPIEPAVLEWDWTTPTSAADHTCLLAVMNSTVDSIPPANKAFDVNVLVRNEKRVGLKNLHVVNAAPGTSFGALVGFFTLSDKRQAIRFLPGDLAGWKIGVVLPKKIQITEAPPNRLGWTKRAPTKPVLDYLKERYAGDLGKYDTSVAYMIDEPEKGAQLLGVALPKAGLNALIVFTAPARMKAAAATLNVVQEEDGRVVGGNTFVLRPPPKA
jgi:hypothetical protein